MRPHFLSFHYIFSVLVICYHSLTSHPPNFAILGKKSQDPFTLHYRALLRKEIHSRFFTI